MDACNCKTNSPSQHEISEYLAQESLQFVWIVHSKCPFVIFEMVRDRFEFEKSHLFACLFMYFHSAWLLYYLQIVNGMKCDGYTLYICNNYLFVGTGSTPERWLSAVPSGVFRAYSFDRAKQVNENQAPPWNRHLGSAGTDLSIW